MLDKDMTGLYDFDGTIVVIVNKWTRLMMKHDCLAAKILKKIPNYEDVKNDMQNQITEYGLDSFFGFNDYESNMMSECLDSCKDFYDEFEDNDIPRFGIRGIDDIHVITYSDGESPGALSKKRLLDKWKAQGKISGYSLPFDKGGDKAGMIISYLSHYDFLAEDHPITPIQICERLSNMKIHMVEYPYNRDTVKYLNMVYPDRLI